MRRDASKVLTDVVQDLSLATNLEAITRLVAAAAREISGADGATFVLREDDKCYYVDENAISPLWKGGKFPLTACISGWAMLNKRHVVIPDIYQDARIPHDAYRPTFVKSLCMIPIRPEAPIGSIGNYWASGYVPSEDEIKFLQALANNTSIALSNLELKQSLLKSDYVRSGLVERKNELEAALHTLAHDMSSPLGTFEILTEVLEEELGPQVSAEARKFLDGLKATSAQMGEQINRMLSLYGITQRKLELQRIDLTKMAESIAEDLLRKYPERKIDFDIGSGLATIADTVLMQVAMENLLGNAVKYTGKKEKALVQLTSVGQTSSLTTFSVRDNGDGFEPHQADKLFRPLVRLHTEKEFKGTGLGLASVARIIEMHGGSIHARGEKSVGATFFFDLPKAV